MDKAVIKELRLEQQVNVVASATVDIKDQIVK